MSAKAAAAAQGEAPAPAEQGEGSQVLQLLHLHWSFDVVRREQRIVLFDTVYHDELVGNGLRVEIAQPWDSAETLQLQEHRLERAPTPVRPALLDNDVVPHRTRMVEMVLETRRNQVNCAKSKRSAVFQQRFEELRAALGASTTAAAATPASARQETKGAEGDSASAGGVQPAAQVRDACFAFFRAVGTHFVRVSMCGGAIYVTCDSKDPAALTLPKLRDDLSAAVFGSRDTAESEVGALLANCAKMQHFRVRATSNMSFHGLGNCNVTPEAPFAFVLAPISDALEELAPRERELVRQQLVAYLNAVDFTEDPALVTARGRILASEAGPHPSLKQRELDVVVQRIESCRKGLNNLGGDTSSEPYKVQKASLEALRSELLRKLLLFRLSSWLVSRQCLASNSTRLHDHELRLFPLQQQIAHCTFYVHPVGADNFLLVHRWGRERYALIYDSAARRLRAGAELQNVPNPSCLFSLFGDVGIEEWLHGGVWARIQTHEKKFLSLAYSLEHNCQLLEAVSDASQAASFMFDPCVM